MKAPASGVLATLKSSTYSEYASLLSVAAALLDSRFEQLPT
ncbi:hypothetical protein NITLEN_20324 [Nitrospira lenta]|uniref:Uncharacterized protein n=1 Tax=Nitrospira lenta TaxID=1436998 RepID=A0A330L4D3_9BACT|nr:hypothetical protein NITLEN_20324 [Nitrospira lenta]